MRWMSWIDQRTCTTSVQPRGCITRVLPAICLICCFQWNSDNFLSETKTKYFKIWFICTALTTHPIPEASRPHPGELVLVFNQEWEIQFNSPVRFTELYLQRWLSCFSWIQSKVIVTVGQKGCIINDCDFTVRHADQDVECRGRAV